MSESLAQQAARLGIRIGDDLRVPAVTVSGSPEPRPARKRSTPGGGLGRPRTCDHDNRRSRVVYRRGRPYTVTFCRTCKTARQRARRRELEIPGTLSGT
jgi:hypothetical protein